MRSAIKVGGAVVMWSCRGLTGSWYTGASAASAAGAAANLLDDAVANSPVAAAAAANSPDAAVGFAAAVVAAAATLLLHDAVVEASSGTGWGLPPWLPPSLPNNQAGNHAIARGYEGMGWREAARPEEGGVTIPLLLSTAGVQWCWLPA